MPYLYLVLAIVFEAGWAIAMKLSDGLSRPWPTIVTIILYLLSLVFLALATKRADVGTTYAVWAGSGAVLIAIAGFLYFKEPASAIKLVSMALVVAGIVGLQLAENRAGPKAHAPSEASR